MAVFRAYYDASGVHGGTGYVVVAGVLATEEKWGRFERLWGGVLAEYGVSHFHMKDFAHSNGEYKHWKGDDPKRAAFLASLAKAAKRGINKAYFVSVSNSTIIEVGRIYEYVAGEGAAYVLTANVCRRRLEGFVQRQYPGSPIHHVFEKGDRGQSKLARLVPLAGKFASFSIVPKQTQDGGRVRPFEIADFIAYEGKRFLDDRDGGQKRPPRLSGWELARTLPIGVSFFEREQMLKMCEAAPRDIIPKRGVSPSVSPSAAPPRPSEPR